MAAQVTSRDRVGSNTQVTAPGPARLPARPQPSGNRCRPRGSRRVGRWRRVRAPPRQRGGGGAAPNSPVSPGGRAGRGRAAGGGGGGRRKARKGGERRRRAARRRAPTTTRPSAERPSRRHPAVGGSNARLPLAAPAPWRPGPPRPSVSAVPSGSERPVWG